MDWLWSVSGYVPDSRRAVEQADAERMRTAFREWIREVRRSPSDGFIRFLLKEVKKDGLNFGSATQDRVEKSKEHFRFTFEHYIDGEMNRVLNEARERLDEEDMPDNTVETLETPAFTKNDQPPLGEFDRPAWRIRGGDWRSEKNGKTLQLAVARWLASVDRRGTDAFYQSVTNTSGDRAFIDAAPEGQQGSYQEVQPGLGYWTRTHMGNSNRLSRLKRWCNQTQKPEGGPVIWDEDIEVRLPVRSKQ